MLRRAGHAHRAGGGQPGQPPRPGVRFRPRCPAARICSPCSALHALALAALGRYAVSGCHDPPPGPSQFHLPLCAAHCGSNQSMHTTCLHACRETVGYSTLLEAVVARLGGAPPPRALLLSSLGLLLEVRCCCIVLLSSQEGRGHLYSWPARKAGLLLEVRCLHAVLPRSREGRRHLYSWQVKRWTMLRMAVWPFTVDWPAAPPALAGVGGARARPAPTALCLHDPRQPARASIAAGAAAQGQLGGPAVGAGGPAGAAAAGRCGEPGGHPRCRLGLARPLHAVPRHLQVCTCVTATIKARRLHVSPCWRREQTIWRLQMLPASTALPSTGFASACTRRRRRQHARALVPAQTARRVAGERQEQPRRREGQLRGRMGRLRRACCSGSSCWRCCA